MKHRSRAIALPFVVVLAACSSGSVGSTASSASPVPPVESAGSPSTPASPAAPPSGAPSAAAVDPREGGFTVGFGEWSVEPETQAVRPGEITLDVRNGGALTHEFKMESEDGAATEFELEGPEFGPGGTVQLDATLPVGTYTIYCPIDDHDERGMTTQLVVRDDAPLVIPAPANAGTVEIRGFAFQPDTITVAAGTDITWRNADSTGHTVTADGAAFGSPPFGNGETFTTQLQDAGTYEYFCAIHPTMRARIEVT